ncbi:MAG: sigma-70 family RNA polymerase sigma factor [Lewinellaceae bacterium]|nr:sigma-70 family RNA polymerase sigma factor [Phaeodactylibacter sp.]MCB9042070.1 sigma-70 family RNA polymerase sigma factor [Lewinellaceae bacterium]
MSEALLWSQLRQGRKAALEALYRAHAPVLLQYGSKFSADQQLVEDCLQDLFVGLWQRREQLGEVSSVQSYLLVAMRRRVVRQLGRQQKRETTEEPEEHQFDCEIAIDEQIAARELSDEQHLKLKAALEQLSSRQKEAVYLKYQLGMDYEDICKAMDISYQSARNLAHSALSRLKELLVLLLYGWIVGWLYR